MYLFSLHPYSLSALYPFTEQVTLLLVMLHFPLFFYTNSSVLTTFSCILFFSFRISEVNFLKNVTGSVTVFFSGFCSFVSYLGKLFPLQGYKKWMGLQTGRRVGVPALLLHSCVISVKLPNLSKPRLLLL